MAFPSRSSRAAAMALLASALLGIATPLYAQREAQALSATFRKAAEQVLPSVVSVRPRGIAAPSFRRGPFRGSPIPPDSFPAMPGMLPSSGDGGPVGGSGLVIDAARGLILTTRQATLGAPRVGVGFTDGREVDAERVVPDPRSDLVLLVVDTQGLRLRGSRVGRAGGTADRRLGAFGGRPSGRTHAVSAGIVSGRGAGSPNRGFDD